MHTTFVILLHSLFICRAQFLLAYKVMEKITDCGYQNKSVLESVFNVHDIVKSKFDKFY